MGLVATHVCGSPGGTFRRRGNMSANPGAPSVSDTQAELAAVSRKLSSCEAALEGQGSYLGIRDPVREPGGQLYRLLVVTAVAQKKGRATPLQGTRGGRGRGRGRSMEMGWESVCREYSTKQILFCFGTHSPAAHASVAFSTVGLLYILRVTRTLGAMH